METPYYSACKGRYPMYWLLIQFKRRPQRWQRELISLMLRLRLREKKATGREEKGERRGNSADSQPRASKVLLLYSWAPLPIDQKLGSTANKKAEEHRSRFIPRNAVNMVLAKPSPRDSKDSLGARVSLLQPSAYVQMAQQIRLLLLSGSDSRATFEVFASVLT